MLALFQLTSLFQFLVVLRSNFGEYQKKCPQNVLQYSQYRIVVELLCTHQI